MPVRPSSTVVKGLRSVLWWVIEAASTELLGDDLEVHGGHHEVDDEQQHEGDDDRLVHGITDALRAAACVEALVRRDDCGQRAEHERLELADVEVGQLGERGERREVGTWGAALQ